MIMTKNITTLDRVIRILIAIILTILYFSGIVTGTLGIILLVVAGIALITGILGYCLVYAIFGIKPNDKSENSD